MISFELTETVVRQLHKVLRRLTQEWDVAYKDKLPAELRAEWTTLWKDFDKLDQKVYVTLSKGSREICDDIREIILNEVAQAKMESGIEPANIITERVVGYLEMARIPAAMVVRLADEMIARYRPQPSQDDELAASSGSAPLINPNRARGESEGF